MKSCKCKYLSETASDVIIIIIKTHDLRESFSSHSSMEEKNRTATDGVKKEIMDTLILEICVFLKNSLYLDLPVDNLTRILYFDHNHYMPPILCQSI